MIHSPFQICYEHTPDQLVSSILNNETAETADSDLEPHLSTAETAERDFETQLSRAESTETFVPGGNTNNPVNSPRRSSILKKKYAFK